MLRSVLVMILALLPAIASAQVQFTVSTGAPRSTADIDAQLGQHAARLADFNIDLGSIEAKYSKLESRLDELSTKVDSFAILAPTITNDIGSINAKLDRLMPKPPEAKPPEDAPIPSKPKAAADVHPAGSHSHKCSACGNVWWHGGDGLPQDHHCPNCGAEQFVINSYADARPATKIVPKTTIVAGLPTFFSGGGCSGPGCRQSARAARKAARSR